MKSAVTISLVPEARGGPFVFWDDLAKSCARARRIGFDAVEIFPPSADALNPAELHKLLDKNRLKLAAIGTGAGWVKHKLRLTDPDAKIRRRARKFAAELIDLAGQFGAPAIIGSMQGRCESPDNRPRVLEWLGEALEDLAERSADHGQPLLFEPLNRYETDVFNRQGHALEFLYRLRARNIRLLCDLFHMNIEEPDTGCILRAFGSMVGHVHFADSNREAIGWGHINMAPIMDALRAIGYSGYLSAEVLPLPNSLAAARQSLESFRYWAQSF